MVKFFLFLTKFQFSISSNFTRETKISTIYSKKKKKQRHGKLNIGKEKEITGGEYGGGETEN